jgi:phosphoribosylanthranilate isomerase
MSVDVKICGLSSMESVAAAVLGGAKFVGFVFFPPSPRNLSPEQAAPLVASVPTGITRVGVFVDPEDELLERVLAKSPLDLLQLHGDETPERVKSIKQKFGRRTIKAIKIADEADMAQAARYYAAADWLMFDARPPKHASRPGGNALAFDWQLLRARRWPLPWMLSGGLTPGNLAEAAHISGAKLFDVSSGVESAPGVKDLGKIKDFLAVARQI